jgi:hypothetical protein
MCKLSQVVFDAGSDVHLDILIGVSGLLQVTLFDNLRGVCAIYDAAIFFVYDHFVGVFFFVYKSGS